MKNIAIVGCGGMGGGHAIAIASGTGNAIWAGVPGQKEGKLQETDSDIGYDGPVCVEVEDKAFEGSKDRIVDSIVLSRKYMEQFVI